MDDSGLNRQFHPRTIDEIPNIHFRETRAFTRTCPMMRLDASVLHFEQPVPKIWISPCFLSLDYKPHFFRVLAGT
jgi:hypothetical protein